MGFTLDTKISLLNGTEKSFGELMTKKSFWIYSCTNNGKIVPAFAILIERESIPSQIIEITLDNNQMIKCNEDQLFLTRNGRYNAANNLQVGDPLMPLYRRYDIKNDNGHEWILHNHNLKWYRTHHMVYESFNNDKPRVKHHVDFNKLNNDPDNITGMTWKEHTKLHYENFKLLNNYAVSEEGRQKSRETMTKLWNDQQWKEQRIKLNKLNGQKTSLRYAIYRSSKRSSLKEFILLEVQKRNNITENARNNLARYNLLNRNGIKNPTQKQKKAWARNAKIMNKKKWNHKITNLEKGGFEITYNLKMDGHHNFAISAGVYVYA